MIRPCGLHRNQGRLSKLQYENIDRRLIVADAPDDSIHAEVQVILAHIACGNPHLILLEEPERCARKTVSCVTPAVLKPAGSLSTFSSERQMSSRGCP